MNVYYCDLCMSPLKDDNYYMLYISVPKPEQSPNCMEEYTKYISEVQRDVKDVCPTCKHIIDKMFELRLQRLSELTTELNLTYHLPVRSDSKGKRDGKEKK